MHCLGKKIIFWKGFAHESKTRIFFYHFYFISRSNNSLHYAIARLKNYPVEISSLDSMSFFAREMNSNVVFLWKKSKDEKDWILMG